MNDNKSAMSNPKIDEATIEKMIATSTLTEDMIRSATPAELDVLDRHYDTLPSHLQVAFLKAALISEVIGRSQSEKFYNIDLLPDLRLSGKDLSALNKATQNHPDFVRRAMLGDKFGDLVREHPYDIETPELPSIVNYEAIGPMLEELHWANEQWRNRFSELRLIEPPSTIREALISLGIISDEEDEKNISPKVAPPSSGSTVMWHGGSTSANVP